MTDRGHTADRGRPLDDQMMSVGLLLETAQTQKTLADSILQKLNEHVRGLDQVVRDEVRRTLIEEMQLLATDSKRAAQSLQALVRAANLRTLLWSAAVTALCSAIPLAEAKWFLPSQAEVAALREQRDALAANMAALERRGALTEIRRCGADARLCVRIDRHAPAYGPAGDYVVIKGY